MGLCTGSVAWVLSGAPEGTQELRMRSSKQRSITLGGVKAKWIKYEVRAQPPGSTATEGGPGSTVHSPDPMGNWRGDQKAALVVVTA